MNTIEQYIEKTEEKGLLLNEYQKTLVYRCALIGMTEDQMDLFVAAGFPVIKEEMIIASILDGMEDDYIRKEIVSEDDISLIKRKRADYLMENFRSNDAEYNQLQEELIMLQTQMKDVDRVIERQRAEYEHLSNEIREKREETEMLKKKLEEKDAGDNIKAYEPRRAVETRIITKYKRPSGLKETIYCLLGKEDSLPIQEETVRSDRQEFFDMIIDSDLSMEQIKEIEQAYRDGIEIEMIKKMANKEFTPERMKALRRMIYVLADKRYAETENTSVEYSSKHNGDEKAFDMAEDDCIVITDDSVKGYETELSGRISLPVTQKQTTDE